MKAKETRGDASAAMARILEDSQVTILGFIAATIALALSYWLYARWAARGPVIFASCDPHQQALCNEEYEAISQEVNRKGYRQARRLLAKGQHLAAGELLASLDMPQTAVAALSSQGYLREAAQLLIARNLADQAGLLLARFEHWREALRCFQLASMPEQAAACALHLGDIKIAAQYLEQAGRSEEAAKAYQQSGDYAAAAHAFFAAGQRTAFINAYERMLAEEKKWDDATCVPTNDEWPILIAHFALQPCQAFTDLAQKHHRLKDLIIAALKANRPADALTLFQCSNIDLGPELLAQEASFGDIGEQVAELFVAAKRFAYAGQLFERLGNGERAIWAYDQAGDLERALSCCIEAGFWDKATAIRARLTRTPVGTNGNFSLASLTTDEASEDLAAGIASTVELSGDTDAIDLGLLNFDSFGAYEPSYSRSRQNSEKPVDLLVEPTITSRRASDIAAFLRARTFASFTQEQRTLLWDLGQIKRFEPGQTILDFGQQPAGAYTILSGRVRCFRESTDGVKQIDEIDDTACFGELWLLLSLRTSVRFIAATTCDIHILERRRLESLVSENQANSAKLYQRLTDTLLTRLMREINPRALGAA